MTGGVCDDDGDARESRLLLQIPKKLEPLAPALWRVAFRAAFPQRPLPRHLQKKTTLPCITIIITNTAGHRILGITATTVITVITVTRRLRRRRSTRSQEQPQAC